MADANNNREEVDLVGVRIEFPHSQPVVLLHHAPSDRYIPIFIGAPEAAAIALEQQKIATPRPMTHDLLVAVVEGLKARIEEVEIVNVEDNVFYAELILSNGAKIDARASDALAIAVRVLCPVFVATDVLASSAVIIEESDESADTDDGEVDEEAEMAKFREFLDDVDPDDFSQQ